MENDNRDQEDTTTTTIGSPSSDQGKMVIKLKIPKAAMEGERSSSMEVLSSCSKDQGKRVCTVCQKEFSSGKALGGHMRIHVNTFLKPSKTTKFKKSLSKNQDFNNGDDQETTRRRRVKPSGGSNYRNSVNEEGKPICSICGKVFPSMKSLFGHMRCHPERLWRGILPPPNTTPIAAVRRRDLKPPPASNSNSTSSLSDQNGFNLNYEEGSNVLEEEDDDGGDQVVDLTEFLTAWTVTERRGRPALRAAADEEEVLREAVEDLMSLANGAPSSMADDSDVTEKQLVFEGSNSNGIDEKLSLSLSLSPEYGKGKAAVVVVKEEEEEKKPTSFSDNESDSRNTNNEQMVVAGFKYKNPNKIKKRKKMKLVMELEEGFTAEMAVAPAPPQELPPESKYKCTTCNKSFSSHQALGGHRSSHNKPKITPADQEDDYESFVMNQDNVEKEVEFSGDATAAVVVAAGGGGLHQCKICDRVFPTGQALGGHKRCHWISTAINEAQAPSSQITSTGETGSHGGGGGSGGDGGDGGGRRVLDFDLNEVPPAAMMEEEEEGGNGAPNGNGNGNGYASSSYNSNMG